MKHRVLIVDDEKLIRWSIAERLRSDGYDIVEAADGRSATEAMNAGRFDAALLDMKLPDANGIDLLKSFHAMAPDMAIIIITAYSSVDSAVEAMKEGAHHYVTKPFNMDELAMTVGRAVEAKSLARRVGQEVDQRKTEFGLSRILGNSAEMRRIKDLVAKVACGDSTSVLVLGESGAGKDLIARAIHYESSRAGQPFMNITCTALPEQLLESELFGHEKGAFTGADARKLGLLEQADGGTVFLDEIGDMSPGLQAKLLRVLEDKSFRRIGATTDVQVDIRIVAATNTDLAQALENGTFREDLYYRLATIPIELPPLRDRKDDIEPLALHFLEHYCREFKRKPVPFTKALLERLRDYAWPGNVRELRNVIERAVLLSSSDRFEEETVVLSRPASASAAGGNDGLMRLPDDGCDLAELEKDLLRQALERCNGNQTRVAKLLRLSRDQVRYKMTKYGLTNSPG